MILLLIVVARFDFSWGDREYHEETLENLKGAIKSTKKLCAVMLDTVGPELQVVNITQSSISLQQDAQVILTPHQGQQASSHLLPINFDGLAKVISIFDTNLVISFLHLNQFYKDYIVIYSYCLQSVKKGDTIFVGQYLFTGSETTSVWLEVI